MIGLGWHDDGRWWFWEPADGLEVMWPASAGVTKAVQDVLPGNLDWGIQNACEAFVHVENVHLNGVSFNLYDGPQMACMSRIRPHDNIDRLELREEQWSRKTWLLVDEFDDC